VGVVNNFAGSVGAGRLFVGAGWENGGGGFFWPGTMIVLKIRLSTLRLVPFVKPL